MNLFLDANIYLSFYRLSSDDLEELRKLAVTVRDRATRLYVAEQVRDEFARNRESIVAESLSHLERARVAGGYPRLFHSLPEFDPMLEALNEYEGQRAALLSRARALAADRMLHADELIRELFALVEVIPLSTEVMEAARARVQRGNPPGKGQSFGDALNWETLLQSVPDGEPLLLVSADGDYASALDRSSLDSFLADEWTGRKRSDATLYTSLSALFKANYPEIRLAAELEKELAVARLLGASSFRETHAAISDLSAYSDFSPNQASAMAEAAMKNDQVSRILHDTDVREFFVELLGEHEVNLAPATFEVLQEATAQPTTEGGSPRSNDDTAETSW